MSEDLQYIDANDTVMISREIDSLQMTINKLVEWAENNDDTQQRKTVIMTFKRGGRQARGDIIKIEDIPLK